MAAKSGRSLASLNVLQASETPFEFERLDDDGSPSGIFLSVLGANSKAVRAARNALIDEQNTKAAIRAANARPGKPADPIPFEESAAFAPRLAQSMLVGWRGIDEEFNAENAKLLCETDPESVSQIIEASNKLSNFTRRSPTA